VDRGARPAGTGERGVTLIELLVVLTLMATLMGLGVSMYVNLGKQGVFTASVTRVLGTLNRVRNSSMTHPAALMVRAGDPEKGEENSVRGEEYVTMFASQCEPPAEGETELQGALDRNGVLPPGAAFRRGVVGQALFLETGGAVEVRNHPAFDATQGIHIDLWVFPKDNQGGVLLHRGEGLHLALTRGAEGPGVRWDLAFRSGAADGPTSSGIVESRRFEPAGLALPVNRWSRVICSYDLFAVTISVDTGRGAVERLREAEKTPLAPSRDNPLFVGGGGQGGTFRGGIDDVRVAGVLGEAYEPFPAQVVVEGPSRRIRYKNGRLDPEYHNRPETLVLHYGKRSRTIVIGIEGNIESK
jgi:prepilin-type N-terminal cleavage/methylation domain-containing protein